MPHGLKAQNVKQKQYCNTLNKDFKNVHIKKKKIQKQYCNTLSKDFKKVQIKKKIFKKILKMKIGAQDSKIDINSF